MLNRNRGSTVILTVKYNIVAALCLMSFIRDTGNFSRNNVDKNWILYRISDAKYWKRGGNGVNSSADKWISTINQ
jgi:hypothetical protein